VVDGIRSVLVFGGRSDLAMATVRVLVKGGTERVVLAARHPHRLEPVAEELRRCGARVVTLIQFDANELEDHISVVHEAFASTGSIDLVLWAAGVLGPSGMDQLDRMASLDTITTNFLGGVSVILPTLARLRDQGGGTLVILSSVAAERPRASNFVYGASKAGLDAFCQGLRDLLLGSAVNVLVVRPGFVRTKMTALRVPPLLTCEPDQVVHAILKGLKRETHTVWAPPAIRFVMGGLRLLPRPIFRRLRI
jgi:decaprenylphospho-beta-D-erythro-pentofuranosid-2-ulose 2-reductase